MVEWGEVGVPEGTMVLMPHPEGEWVGFRHPEGKWNVPGGKVESGENPRFAAFRETIEEVGITPPHLVSLGSFIHQVEIGGVLRGVRTHAFFSRIPLEDVLPDVRSTQGGRYYRPVGVIEEILTHMTHGRFPSAVREAFLLLRSRTDLYRYWRDLPGWRSESK